MAVQQSLRQGYILLPCPMPVKRKILGMISTMMPVTEINQADIAGFFNGKTAQITAQRNHRSGNHPGNADHSPQHVVGHNCLTQTAGVDVEENAQSIGKRPKWNSDPQIGIDGKDDLKECLCS